MADIPFEHGLLLAAALFALGLVGVLVRRNVIFILVSIEIMLNAAGLAFVVAGAHLQQGQEVGQVMFFFILSRAAAEVAVGLALVLRLHHRLKTLDADELSKMRG